MIVSINQPGYLPWLGYYHRMVCSDLHVVLDTVQFEKNSFTNRNRIRTADGWMWLTVPVLTKGMFGDLVIRDLEINTNTRWQRKHWQSIRQNYSKAPHFDLHSEFFSELFEREWNRLDPLCEEIDDYLLDELGITTERVRSSNLAAAGTKSDLVLNICQELGATTYLSGELGRAYLDEEAFFEEGIAVEYQHYSHPTYAQVHDGFKSHMSTIDLLFNCGDDSFDILMVGDAGEGGK